MAVLTPAQRIAVRSELAQAVSDLRESIGVTKDDLLAAVNAIDQWIDDNKLALNNAIPQPARGALTAAQKARLFMLVARARFNGGA